MDIIICNPPYVRKKDKVSKEVKYEPKKSVFRPHENIFKEVVSQINNKLDKDGIALIEIGRGQKREIKKVTKVLIKESRVSFIKDYLEIYRVAKIET